MPRLDDATVDRIVRAALTEDLGEAGDVTTAAVIDADDRTRATIVAREPLVLSGLPLARAVFAVLDGTVVFEAAARDGDAIARDRVVAEITGPTAPILAGERTALNFLMRMSGIATAARSAVEEVRGTGARILDTRKTAPGLRALDKYAVLCGGAENHRMGLFDAAMIKDTHLGAGGTITDAVARLLDRGITAKRITVECRDLEQLGEAIAAGAGRALLDNMTADELREAVTFARGRIELEASGGLRPGALREVAQSGVDHLSMGWLTHSSRAADLAMETVRCP